MKIMYQKLKFLIRNLIYMNKRSKKRERQQNEDIKDLKQDVTADQKNEELQGRKFEELEDQIKELTRQLEEQKEINRLQQSDIDVDKEGEKIQEEKLEKFRKEIEEVIEFNVSEDGTTIT
ncbi:MAG: hypothetical protein AABY22_29015, partial [Nanoarchaeota archaeon]